MNGLDHDSVCGLKIHRAHVLLRIAGTSRTALGKHAVDFPQLSRSKRDLERLQILLQTSSLLGPEDGHDVLALRHYPRQRNLRGGSGFGIRQSFNVPYQIKILIEVIARKSRVKPPEVVLRDVLGPLEFASQEAAPQRAIRHKTDAEFANRCQNILLGVASPERILSLQRGDGMHAMSAPYG